MPVFPRFTATASGVMPFVRMETSAPVVDVLYRYGQVDAASSGAYGPNVTAPLSRWYLEYQRQGGTDVIDGVVRHDPEMVAEGLRMFHFGLAREASNGGFPGSVSPFHGTAFFLSEAAPALVVLTVSLWASRFALEVRWQIARMRRAAYYIVRTVGGPGRIDDRSKNHRFYEAAIALGAVGVLAGDRTLERWSRRYVVEGIQMERANGVMPENGGHDSGYQALGMVSAARYLTLVAKGALYRRLSAVLARAAAWELSRVQPDGSVNQEGDTRTAGCQERDALGHCKTVFYAPIFSALAHWAAISGDAAYRHASYLVWQRSGYSGH